MIKQFKDLNDGDLFKLDNVQFKKIPTVKVSCCRSINAEDVSNSKKAFVKPESEVEVDDQLQ
jgi:hypothetical protein